MRQYIEAANAFRALFYERKANTLQEHDPTLRTVEISQLLVGSLRSMLGGKESRVHGLRVRDRGVYVNDKIMQRVYTSINDGFNGYHQESNHKSHPS